MSKLRVRGDLELLFQELLKAVETRESSGKLNIDIKGITYDSRQVEPGYLFVAIRGFKADGHEYICQAYERGAAAVVMERKAFLPPGMAWAMVRDTRYALAALSTRFYGNPSVKMKMIGVTGTNGKTTTTNLLATVLRATGCKVGLIGTIHNKIGDRVLPVKHTTPESTDLQRLFSDMYKEDVKTCVMEVSSHALALHRVDGCDFDVTVFTNLTQDHLDFHRDMEEYLKAKIKLFRGLAAPSEKKGTKYAVINTDDTYAPQFIKAADGTVCTYGIKNPADVWAKDIKMDAGGVSFTVDGKWGKCPLNLKITGLFNVYNALAAYTAAAVLEVPPKIIKEVLENTRGVPGRFELVGVGQDFAVIVDYAHTPDGLDNILKTARQLAKGRLITVFGCGGDRDRTKRPLMGGIAARSSDYVLITSDNPRTEDPLKIIDDIEAGVRPVAKGSYTVEPDRRRAIRLAVGMARAGDVIVIAGKGHEDYQIIGSQRLPFDDRKEAESALMDKQDVGSVYGHKKENGLL